MIKQTITYKTHFGNERTEDFYFNMDPLEAAEFELKYNGLDTYVERITESQEATDAYYLLKDLILWAYGKRAENDEFHKKDPVTQALYRVHFESSAALGELIFGFLKDPKSAIAFINGLLPEHVRQQMAEVKGAGETQHTPSVSILSSATVEENTEPTDEELLKMRPQDMTQAQLVRAMELKIGKKEG